MDLQPPSGKPRFGPLLPLLLAFVASCSGSCGRGSDVKRPNVVLILVDTLRADAIHDEAGYFTTPNIDALAADGVSFTHAFSHAPMTLPSHTSLFSSRPPFETGVLNNGQNVPESLPMLADWLSDYGYSTRAVISLGTLNLGKRSGVKRGFDVYDVEFWRIAKAPEVAERLRSCLDDWNGREPLFLFAHYSDPHEPYCAHDAVSRAVQVFVDGEPIDDVPISEAPKWRKALELAPGRHVVDVRSADRFRIRQFDFYEDGDKKPVEWAVSRRLQSADHAQLVVEQTSDSPETCELAMWINDALTPSEAKLRYVSEVQFVDRYVGELIDDLKRRGVYEDSLILFVSDHGESLGEHDHVGHVQGLTDVQIQVPLIVKAPRGHPAVPALRAARDQLVPLVDVVPTVLELVGLPPLPGQRGTSLLTSRSTIHVAQTHKPEADQDRVCFRDERYKMTFVRDEDRFEMFDLVEDPGETRDVFETQGHLRADWPEQLRSIARIAVERARKPGDLDEETLTNLEALGYGG